MPAIAATAPRTTPAETSAASTHAQRRRCASPQEDDTPTRCDAPQRRGHALVSAMMSALGTLMPGTPAQGNAQVDASAGEELKSSAEAFAHALFDALRGSGEHGRARGHGHHHRHGEGHGYGNLAQRLDRLARQVDSPPASTVTSTTTISASLSTASFSASIDGDSASAELSVTTLQIDITQQTTTASAASESPLQAAFRKLFDALQPAGSAASGSSAGASAGGLSGFLRQLADALRNGGGTDDHTMAPATGGLLSLAA